MPDEPVGSSRSTSPSQRFQSPTTATFWAFGAHTANDDAAVDEMGAELLVDPLVPALAREMEVELTQPAAGRRRGRLRHQNSASSIRRIPATGIPTQSGRLSSS